MKRLVMLCVAVLFSLSTTQGGIRIKNPLPRSLGVMVSMHQSQNGILKSRYCPGLLVGNKGKVAIETSCYKSFEQLHPTATYVNGMSVKSWTEINEDLFPSEKRSSTGSIQDKVEEATKPRPYILVEFEFRKGKMIAFPGFPKGIRINQEVITEALEQLSSKAFATQVNLH